MEPINDILMIRLYNGYLKVINSEYNELINHIFIARGRLDKLCTIKIYRKKKEKESVKEAKKFWRKSIKLLQEQTKFLDAERNKMYAKYKELRIKNSDINK